MATREPSSLRTDDCSMASLGLMARAFRDGAPDILAELPHPQSVSSVAKRLLPKRFVFDTVRAPGANARAG